MNKYKEALKGLVETVRNNGCSFVGDCLKNGECKYNDAKLMCDDYVRFKTLQELVEKATPKKPIEYPSFASGYKCPNCENNIVLHGSHKICPTPCCSWCGQELDWSE